jgi:hypothetical protein
MPVAGTSALVGVVTVVALTLVVLTAVRPAPARLTTPSSTSAPGAGTRPWISFVRPQDPAPTTTTPPTTTPAPPTVATPATTVPVAAVRTPPTTRPVPHPAPPRPPAPPVIPVVGHPIVPPANPPANIAESPDFATICRQDGAASAPCITAATEANNAARGHEGLGAMVLPSNFAALTPGEQLFVLTDSERVDRGLPAVVGMVAELDTDAQNAAAANTDPTPSSVPPGSTVTSWASNWAEASGPLGSNYDWMYDDGPGSGDVDCTASNPGSCWGHRDNILGFNASKVAASHGVLVMGAAQATVAGDSPWTSDALLIALVTGNPAYTYTWAQAEAAGAR